MDCIVFCKLLIINAVCGRVITPGKRVTVKSGSGVRIPLSPQETKEMTPIHNVAKCC